MSQQIIQSAFSISDTKDKLLLLMMINHHNIDNKNPTLQELTYLSKNDYIDTYNFFKPYFKNIYIEFAAILDDQNPSKLSKFQLGLYKRMEKRAEDKFLDALNQITDYDSFFDVCQTYRIDLYIDDIICQNVLEQIIVSPNSSEKGKKSANKFLYYLYGLNKIPNHTFSSNK